MSKSNAAAPSNSKPIVDVINSSEILKNAVGVRSFNNALRLILEKHIDDILPEWSTDDLSALLANIIRYQCNKSGVEIFAKNFNDTSVDDIMTLIEKLRRFNREASNYRFILPKPGIRSTSEGTEKVELPEKPTPTHNNANKAFTDWGGGAVLASRTRKIPDESPVLLPKTIVNSPVETERTNVSISKSPFMRCNNLMGSPNYERIYQHLGSMLSSRCVSKARSLDAAILLNVLDDLDADTDKFTQHIDFFKAVFPEIAQMDTSEFKVDADVNEQNIGVVSTNVFGLPEELFDLSFFLKQNDDNK